MKNKLTMKTESSGFKADYPLANELPYWDFADDVVVLIDGTLVMGLELKGVSIETKDAAALNRICHDLRSFLNAIPEGTELSFATTRKKTSKALVEAHARCGSRNENIDWISEARRDNLANKIENEEILSTSIHLYLYKRLAVAQQRNLFRFFSAPRKFVSVKKAQFQCLASELRQALGSIADSLESTGIAATRLGSQEIKSEIYTFLNPMRSKVLSAPHGSLECRQQEFTPSELVTVPELGLPSPREQLAFADILCQRDALFYDGYYHRCITLKTLPEFTHASLAGALTELPFAHSVNVHIKIPEQSKELASLQAKRRMAHSLSLSHDGRPNDLESEAKLGATEDLLRDLISTGQKIFYFQCTLYICAESLEKLEQRTRVALLKFQELNGAEGLVETVGTLKVWKSILPFGSLNLPRSKRVKTDNLADFLPVYQPYTGAPGARPHCLFMNRQDGLVNYDPFHPQLLNFNTLITGSSGAGKSFVNNQILTQYMSQNPLVNIIDVGGSYRKLCEFVGGSYIEFAPAADNCAVTAINPFELPKGELRPTARKTKFLLAMLESILSDGDKGQLPKLHRSLLEAQIERVYESTAEGPPTLSRFTEQLKGSGNSLLIEYASMLYPWTGTRPYGQLLDVQKGLDVATNMVVFDLKGLSMYPDLQGVMLLIITDFILGRVDASPRGLRIVMDECWELLKATASRNFMEYCVRTLRKSGSGITFVTQGLEEIAASPIGPAILSSTATKIVLKQQGDLTPVQHLLKLNNFQMAQIASLRQQKGKYSEALLISNDEASIIRIQPAPLDYWLATSDPVDNAAFFEHRKKHPNQSIAEIISDLAARYPCGVSEAP